MERQVRLGKIGDLALSGSNIDRLGTTLAGKVALK
jgi:hypothetical protein